MSKSNSSVVGGLTAAAVIAFAAPVLADDVTLECQVTARVESQTSDRVQTQDWGHWRISVSADRGVVHVEEARHFAIDDQPRLLEWIDTKAEVTADRITFCASDRGCGQQLNNLMGADGWYRIERGVIDRRRSTLEIEVERENASIGYHTITVYSGACAPQAPRQF